jgi:hypothetical protein
MTAFRQIQSTAVRKNVIALVETVATASKTDQQQQPDETNAA